MKRLAVIPSDPIDEYIKSGYSPTWLREYYNPCQSFDEVYLFSPHEKDCSDLLGMRVINTKQQELKQRIKDFNIDIVRAYGGNWACEMACENKVSGIPVVVSVHDSNAQRLYDSIKKSDIVLCISDAVRNLVRSKFKNKDRLWLLPNRVDFNVMFPYKEEKLRDLDKKYCFQYRILHVGRRSREKNLDTLIKALPLLGNNYCLIAIGQGNVDFYKEIVSREGVQEQVFFIESVPHQELARYFSFADCMCTPSRWEGFGMVFIEALACEAVLVTSDIAPLNEYISNEKNGLLVKEYENPQALAEVVRRACEDKIIRESIRKQTRLSVEKFERKQIDALEASYYEKILLMNKNKEFRQSLWKRN